MKKIHFFIIISFVSFTTTNLFAVLEIKSFGVDGSSNNANVVIKNRSAMFFWEYSGVVSKFEVTVSSTNTGLLNGTTIWHLIGSTNTLNTINFITRVPSKENLFEANKRYYWKLTLFDNALSSVSVSDTFFTVFSAVTLSKDVSDLKVDENNPFCPLLGETTRFRYMLKDNDAEIKLQVFNIAGKYVKTIAQHIAYKDMQYTAIWDGKDKEGKILPEGMYIVSLVVDGAQPVNKLVGIIKKR